MDPEIFKVLADDQSADGRKVLRLRLSQSPFLEVVRTSHDGEEALALTETLPPHVITRNLVMPPRPMTHDGGARGFFNTRLESEKVRDAVNEACAGAA